MSITLILNGKQRRKLHLPKQRLAWVGGIFFTVLALSGGWLWQSWHQKMEALEVALAMAEQQKSTQGADEAREQLAMLAAEVGTMQGQLGRLNALGERLTEKADLDPEEFNFKELPPMGGPSYDADLEVSLNELQDSMKHLSQQLSSREEQLSVLESFIMNHHITDAGFISGTPVKQERVWVSSGFGGRVDPFNGRAKMHKGVDFRGKPGTPILATGPGVVSWAGRHPEFGNMVEINHGNGLVTRYAHNSKLLVEVGTLVDEGQKIALMGRTGRATGVHLHYEVLKDGRQVDPARFLNARRG
ncbi:peptidoglycan DD-metalloendopeptidase family protein [Aeromonas hydrophila]|uniref:peptidoglycan DD-metalloendopeptidase family protein n=1 Tax=Aeromonas hydrophila TaxID=644 RepID=UPI0007603856|nr:peptidoglycan DD-metalloendopeptidase family protein [Aeromonas hydrophila]KWR65687.1 peptidase M23 [Aeromonas hydrophila]HAU4929406.1 peptidoglycan DD-metalloendopeptidase family protein [Aeromonas hydrophila]